MSRWDELEKAAKRANPDAEWFRVKDLEGWHSNIDTRAARFMVQANPKAVLALIEQNRELLQALKTCLAYGATGPYKWVINQAHEAIRKATGEEA